jgi:hypothetical protein
MTVTTADHHLVSRHTADGFVFATRDGWSGMEGHPLTDEEVAALRETYADLTVEPYPKR